MTTYTPGPWETSRDAVPDGHTQITVYAESDGERVATAFRSEANAHLIASAPSLYLYVATQAAGGDNEAIKLMEVIDGEMRDVRS